MSENDNNKTALITGISGQDGAYLSDFLIKKGYRVVGTSRDSKRNDFKNLRALKLRDRVEIFDLSLHNYESVVDIIESVKPVEIYHLSAQSSVAESFSNPYETLMGSRAALNLLEAVRRTRPSARIFNCTSSECFGNTSDDGATENTRFSPLSPYAVSKVNAHIMVENYREMYGLYCCSGILFNHESPLRPERYVTKKIVEGARKASQGYGGKLRLGNLGIQRDWGLAAEFVEAMWLMLQQPSAKDYVIATGKASTLSDFLELSFSAFKLNWQDHVVTDSLLFRPHDIQFSLGNPAKIESDIGWKARAGLPEIVSNMVWRVDSES